MEVPKLLFVKKYEVGFELSVYQGENVLIVDSPPEKLTRNIEAMKPFTGMCALEFGT